MRCQKGKLNVIKREKRNYIIFSSVGFADWFLEFKRYLKNKLVHENCHDMSFLLAPDYGLLVINDVIMTSLLLLKVINVLANSLISSDALLF